MFFRFFRVEKDSGIVVNFQNEIQRLVKVVGDEFGRSLIGLHEIMSTSSEKLPHYKKISSIL
jgi:hypothetical protein